MPYLGLGVLKCVAKSGSKEEVVAAKHEIETIRIVAKHLFLCIVLVLKMLLPCSPTVRQEEANRQSKNLSKSTTEMKKTKQK